MVCNRCIMAVESLFNEQNIALKSIKLGEVETDQMLNDDQLKNISSSLEALGFEIIDNRKSAFIEKIKTTIINLVHHNSEPLKTNLSHFLSEQLHYDNVYMSNLFSEVEGTTIEKFYISQRIEKAKELLVYDELTLSEIAHRLNYSSVAHLSNQFKKVTGLTPSHFKNIGAAKRQPIDKV